MRKLVRNAYIVLSSVRMLSLFRSVFACSLSILSVPLIPYNELALAMCICDVAIMFSGGVCIEVLVSTIVVWIGLWGLVEEAVSTIPEKKWKCCAYGCLLCSALIIVAVQQQVTVCALL